MCVEAGPGPLVHVTAVTGVGLRLGRQCGRSGLVRESSTMDQWPPMHGNQWQPMQTPAISHAKPVRALHFQDRGRRKTRFGLEFTASKWF